MRSSNAIMFHFHKSEYEVEVAREAVKKPGESVYFEFNTGMPVDSTMLVHAPDGANWLIHGKDESGRPCWRQHMAGNYYLFDAAQCSPGGTDRLSR